MWRIKLTVWLISTVKRLYTWIKGKFVKKKKIKILYIRVKNEQKAIEQEKQQIRKPYIIEKKPETPEELKQKNMTRGKFKFKSDEGLK